MKLKFTNKSILLLINFKIFKTINKIFIYPEIHYRCFSMAFRCWTKKVETQGWELDKFLIQVCKNIIYKNYYKNWNRIYSILFDVIPLTNILKSTIVNI